MTVQVGGSAQHGSTGSSARARCRRAARRMSGACTSSLFSSPRMNVRTSAAAVLGATSWMPTAKPAAVLEAASVSAAGRSVGEVTIRYSSPQALRRRPRLPSRCARARRAPSRSSRATSGRCAGTAPPAPCAPASRSQPPDFLKVTVTSIDVKMRARRRRGSYCAPGTCTAPILRSRISPEHAWRTPAAAGSRCRAAVGAAVDPERLVGERLGRREVGGRLLVHRLAPASATARCRRACSRARSTPRTDMRAPRGTANRRVKAGTPGSPLAPRKSAPSMFRPMKSRPPPLRASQRATGSGHVHLQRPAAAAAHAACRGSCSRALPRRRSGACPAAA